MFCAKLTNKLNQMKNKQALIFSLVLLFMSLSQILKAQIEFGVFTDCQYCDCETKGTRFYSNSIEKLQNCINQFNSNKNIQFVVGLGDLIDRNITSFDSINAILVQSKTKVYQVIGNHDLAVENEYLDKVPDKLNLDKTWYSFEINDWRFIFLNGNDITIQSNNMEIVEKAITLTTVLKQEGKPNYHEWNGGIGKEQLQWMESQLLEAQKSHQKAILFCHYPLLPYDAHSLWNSDEVLDILRKYDNVKCWMNGHNHAGNYVYSEGIHFLNLKGMVETEKSNAFASIKLNDDTIEVHGFGNEPQRVLQIQ
jgi:manganese-dependent ADP-ribose/CDP-alcohol diphosphatase